MDVTETMLQVIRSSAELRRLLTGSRMALFNEEKIVANVVKPMSIDIGGEYLVAAFGLRR